MPTPPPAVVATYTKLLERAIVNLRMRLRCDEDVSLEEVHDILDALHNVPIMLQNYGGWNIEENIDWYLAHYDGKWVDQPGSERRDSLIETLMRIRAGEYPNPCDDESQGA